MRFDWESLLRRRSVDYVVSGPNVSRGEINVTCPRCDDPSHHLGISPEGRGWRCLRCGFSGRSRSVLIQALLRCDYDEARELAGYDRIVHPDDDDLRRVIGGLGVPRTASATYPSMPRELKPLLCGSPMAAPIVCYAEDRGYRGADLRWVAREYDLRYATVGKFAGRLVIPVRDRRGRLVTWLGRAGRDWAEPRYLTLSVDPDRAAYGQSAAYSIKSTLLGLPMLWAARDPRALVVCEGPLDAIRITLYGHSMGVYGTCMFGLSISDDQMDELGALADRFPRVGLCIDRGEELRRARMLAQLATGWARPESLYVPVGVKDPGDMSPEQAVDFCLRVVRK